ncbi:DNA glycosylase AlkZ-like family protein, partial [Catenulispora rubra]|uniref:DNA glycosylase AlkZ-like family protein n=1 Tax=Catenulispora rubra TaxID=280293 RepID=UPI001891F9AA
MSADEVRWLRVRAQGLAGDGADAVAAAVRTAAALQAQAAGPVRLQVWARTSGLRAADVDAAVAEAAVVRTWLMRGTIHLVARDDLRAFLAVLGPVNLRAGRRRREQLGLGDALCARAMDALSKILGGGRALTRAEIVAELAGHGVVLDLKSQQPPHLLAYAANSALICRGPDAARDEPTYVLLDDWLEPAALPDRETALTRLTERYFAAYGPATTADLVAWSGLPAADAQAAVALVRDGLEEVEHDGQRLLLPRSAGAGAEATPTPPQN